MPATSFPFPVPPAPRRPLPRLRRAVKAAVAAGASGWGAIIRVATEQPVAALTFDDGPHPTDTPALLEVLAARGARATFFMVGKSARRHPEIVRRVAAAGHAIGNHSWDHSSLPLLRGRHRRDQLRWCQEALAPHGAPLLRPPYGEQTLGSRLDAARVRLRVVCWDVNAEDWRDDAPEQLVERILTRLRPGSIVLLHDTLYTTIDERYRERGPTRQAVSMLLDRLAPGVRFVTVPELLGAGRPVYWPWLWRLPRGWLQQVR